MNVALLTVSALVNEGIKAGSLGGAKVGGVIGSGPYNGWLLGQGVIIVAMVILLPYRVLGVWGDGDVGYFGFEALFPRPLVNFEGSVVSPLRLKALG